MYCVKLAVICISVSEFIYHILCFYRVTEVVQMLYRIPQGSTIEVRITCISFMLFNEL